MNEPDPRAAMLLHTLAQDVANALPLLDRAGRAVRLVQQASDYLTDRAAAVETTPIGDEEAARLSGLLEALEHAAAGFAVHRAAVVRLVEAIAGLPSVQAQGVPIERGPPFEDMAKALPLVARSFPAPPPPKRPPPPSAA